MSTFPRHPTLDVPLKASLVLLSDFPPGLGRVSPLGLLQDLSPSLL